MHLPTRSLLGLIATATVAAPVIAAQTTPAAKPAANKAAAPAAKPAAKPAAPAKAASLPSGVVIQINGKNVTRTDLISTLEALGGQPLLRQIITNTVVEQEAKRLGVSVTEAEVNNGIAEAKQSITMQTGQPFAQAANRMGISEGLLRFEIRRQILTRKAYAKSIEKDVPALDNQIKVSHILIATEAIPGPTGESKPLTDEEAKKKIDGILADVRAGKKTFDAAAQEFSDDPGSKTTGGKMDIWFGKTGQMDQAFSDAAFKLANTGDISEPVKSQFGWHIIRLDQKGATATAQDKSAYKKEMLDRMSQDPRGSQMWLQGLIENAKITTNLNALKASAPAATPAKSAAVGQAKAAE